jgi:plastocyanin
VAKTWPMTIMGYAFDPDTPSIHVGDSIKVTNKDPVMHSFTAKNGSFDSGLLARDQSKTLRFSKAGVFDFYCTSHPTVMTGQLRVSP